MAPRFATQELADGFSARADDYYRMRAVNHHRRVNFIQRIQQRFEAYVRSMYELASFIDDENGVMDNPIELRTYSLSRLSQSQLERAWIDFVRFDSFAHQYATEHPRGQIVPQAPASDDGELDFSLAPQAMSEAVVVEQHVVGDRLQVYSGIVHEIDGIYDETIDRDLQGVDINREVAVEVVDADGQRHRIELTPDGQVNPDVGQLQSHAQRLLQIAAHAPGGGANVQLRIISDQSHQITGGGDLALGEEFKGDRQVRRNDDQGVRPGFFTSLYIKIKKLFLGISHIQTPFNLMRLRRGADSSSVSRGEPADSQRSGDASPRLTIEPSEPADSQRSGDASPRLTIEPSELADGQLARGVDDTLGDTIGFLNTTQVGSPRGGIDYSASSLRTFQHIVALRDEAVETIDLPEYARDSFKQFVHMQFMGSYTESIVNHSVSEFWSAYEVGKRLSFQYFRGESRQQGDDVVGRHVFAFKYASAVLTGSSVDNAVTTAKRWAEVQSYLYYHEGDARIRQFVNTYGLSFPDDANFQRIYAIFRPLVSDFATRLSFGNGGFFPFPMPNDSRKIYPISNRGNDDDYIDVITSRIAVKLITESENTPLENITNDVRFRIVAEVLANHIIGLPSIREQITQAIMRANLGIHDYQINDIIDIFYRVLRTEIDNNLRFLYERHIDTTDNVITADDIAQVVVQCLNRNLLIFKMNAQGLCEYYNSLDEVSLRVQIPNFTNDADFMNFRRYMNFKLRNDTDIQNLFPSRCLPALRLVQGSAELLEIFNSFNQLENIYSDAHLYAYRHVNTIIQQSNMDRSVEENIRDARIRNSLTRGKIDSTFSNFIDGYIIAMARFATEPSIYSLFNREINERTRMIHAKNYELLGKVASSYAAMYARKINSTWIVTARTRERFCNECLEISKRTATFYNFINLDNIPERDVLIERFGENIGSMVASCVDFFERLDVLDADSISIYMREMGAICVRQDEGLRIFFQDLRRYMQNNVITEIQTGYLYDMARFIWVQFRPTVIEGIDDSAYNVDIFARAFCYYQSMDIAAGRYSNIDSLIRVSFSFLEMYNKLVKENPFIGIGRTYLNRYFSPDANKYCLVLFVATLRDFANLLDGAEIKFSKKHIRSCALFADIYVKLVTDNGYFQIVTEQLLQANMRFSIQNRMIFLQKYAFAQAFILNFLDENTDGIFARYFGSVHYDGNRVAMDFAKNFLAKLIEVNSGGVLDYLCNHERLTGVDDVNFWQEVFDRDEVKGLLSSHLSVMLNGVLRNEDARYGELQPEQQQYIYEALKALDNPLTASLCSDSRFLGVIKYKHDFVIKYAKLRSEGYSSEIAHFLAEVHLFEERDFAIVANRFKEYIVGTFPAGSEQEKVRDALQLGNVHSTLESVSRIVQANVLLRNCTSIGQIHYFMVGKALSAFIFDSPELHAERNWSQACALGTMLVPEELADLDDVDYSLQLQFGSKFGIYFTNRDVARHFANIHKLLNIPSHFVQHVLRGEPVPQQQGEPVPQQQGIARCRVEMHQHNVVRAGSWDILEIQAEAKLWASSFFEQGLLINSPLYNRKQYDTDVIDSRIFYVMCYAKLNQIDNFSKKFVKYLAKYFANLYLTLSKEGVAREQIHALFHRIYEQLTNENASTMFVVMPMLINDFIFNQSDICVFPDNRIQSTIRRDLPMQRNIYNSLYLYCLQGVDSDNFARLPFTQYQYATIRADAMYYAFMFGLQENEYYIFAEVYRISFIDGYLSRGGVLSTLDIQLNNISSMLCAFFQAKYAGVKAKLDLNPKEVFLSDLLVNKIMEECNRCGNPRALSIFAKVLPIILQYNYGGDDAPNIVNSLLFGNVIRNILTNIRRISYDTEAFTSSLLRRLGIQGFNTNDYDVELIVGLHAISCETDSGEGVYVDERTMAVYDGICELTANPLCLDYLMHQVFQAYDDSNENLDVLNDDAPFSVTYMENTLTQNFGLVFEPMVERGANEVLELRTPQYGVRAVAEAEQPAPPAVVAVAPGDGVLGQGDGVVPPRVDIDTNSSHVPPDSDDDEHFIV